MGPVPEDGNIRLVNDGRRRLPKSRRCVGIQASRAPDERIPTAVPAIGDSEARARERKRKRHLKTLVLGHAPERSLRQWRLTCSDYGYALRGSLVGGKYRHLI
jgi:hypothetical protein